MEPKEIEIKILGIEEDKDIIKNNEYIHIWDILKIAQKNGISERQTRNAIKYLKSREMLEQSIKNNNEYKITEMGKKRYKELIRAQKETKQCTD
jgi:DNA-binding transcriptional regulator PaaX